MAQSNDWGRRLTVIGNGQNTVASAGTAEALASALTVSSLTIKALIGNTGIMYVGDSSVAAANGFELNPGDAVSLEIVDLSTVYIDAATTSDGVSFVYLR